MVLSWCYQSLINLLSHGPHPLTPSLQVEQAKGLEFETVILFNLFKDSLCDKEWGVVLLEQFAHDLAAHKHLRPLKFNREKHAELMSEIKILYARTYPLFTFCLHSFTIVIPS
jgi:hypothetical protein